MNVRQDLLFGFRQMLRHPVLYLLIIATLAIGIGPNVAIFSVLNALLLEPLPYPEQERLVQVWETDVGARWTQPMSYQNFQDMKAQSSCFEGFGLQSPRSFSLGGAEPELVKGVAITADALTIWDIPPERGRLFTEREVNDNWNLVIISHGLWQRRFASDPEILGRNLRINGEPFTVIGVMPEDFEYHTAWSSGQDIELWAPLAVPDWADRGSHWVLGVARLRDGVTIDQAEAEMRAIAGRLQQLYPKTNARSQVWLRPFHDQVVGGTTSHIVILMVAVGFVLLTACANVASMLLARSADRRTEVAIRGCLGSTRRRLFAQFLSESLLVSLFGGLAGILLSIWSIELLTTFMPPSVPRAHAISIDGGVLVFAVALAVLTGIAFGLVPALTATRVDIASIVREGSLTVTTSRGQQRLLRCLTVTQIAVAFMLASGATLLFSSYRNLMHEDYSFDEDHVVTSRISLDGSRYDSDEHRVLFWENLVERISTRPRVAAAAMTTKLPLEGGTNTEILVAGESYDPNVRRRLVEQTWISPNYFEAMGIPLLKGRVFAPNEGTEEHRVVVVNQALVERYWPDEDPLGRQISANAADPSWHATIAGVVDNVPQWGPSVRPLPELYFPIRMLPARDGFIIVRTQDDALTQVPMIQKQVLELDPDLALAQARTMRQVLEQATRARRFITALIGSFALIAVVLSMIGVFGTMAHKVTRRTREIGIRAAFGAHSGRILGLVLREGLGLTAIGIALGFVLMWVFAMALASQFYGIGAINAIHILVIAFVLMATSLIATLLPAVRASRVDPMDALRQ